MKQLLTIITLCSLVLCIVSCGSSSNEKEVTGDIDKIDVSIKNQGVSNGKIKIVVWVQNNTPYIFSGTLRVKFLSNGSEIDGESVFVENLVPKQKTYAIIWCRLANSVSAEQSWSDYKFIEENKSSNQSSTYKSIKEKNESTGLVAYKVEFIYAPDRNYDKMYEFIKEKKVNEGYIYNAIFIDNEKFAKFSKYPLSSKMFDEDVSKHIIATYEYIPKNDFKEFLYYEKNSFVSKAIKKSE